MKKILKTTLLISILFIILSLEVNASDGYICKHGYHTFGDYHMGYGVGQYGKNRRYYYASGFDSEHMQYIADAVSEWVNTSPGYPNVKTSISIRKTTTKKSAMFEVVNTYIGWNVLGETQFFLYDDEVLVNSEGTLTKNYGWSRCNISVVEMDKHKTVHIYRKAVISHELGHAMGLSHQNTRTTSIMCEKAYGGTATRADAKDCETINHIYG